MHWIASTQVDRFLLDHPWVPALLWVVLYTSDCCLTMLGARLRNAQSFYQFEGSYELTPEYQKDIDQRRRFSRTFVVWLAFGVAVMLIPAFVDSSEVLRPLWCICVGALLIPELVVHKRHVQNIVLYRRLATADPGVRGQLVMSVRFTYWLSALDLACSAGLVTALFAFALSPVLLGGALAVGRTAFTHRKLAKQASSGAAAEAAEAEPAVSSSTTEEVQS